MWITLRKTLQVVILCAVVATTWSCAKVKPQLFGADVLKEASLLQLDSDKLQELTEALQSVETDPIASMVVLKRLAAGQGRTEEQRTWFSRQINVLDGALRSKFDAEFREAEANLDWRRAALLVSLEGKVHSGFETKPDRKMMIQALSKAALAGDPKCRRVWDVSLDKIRKVAGSYSEGGAGGRGLTLIPHDGFHLVRVTANVANPGTAADPSYLLEALSPMQYALSNAFQKDIKGGASAQQLWLVHSLMFLADERDQLHQVAHVCAGSAMRGLGEMMVSSPTGEMRLVPIIEALNPGETKRVDLLFNLPQDAGKMRLVVVGAPPIPL